MPGEARRSAGIRQHGRWAPSSSAANASPLPHSTAACRRAPSARRSSARCSASPPPHHDPIIGPLNPLPMQRRCLRSTAGVSSGPRCRSSSSGWDDSSAVLPAPAPSRSRRRPPRDASSPALINECEWGIRCTTASEMRASRRSGPGVAPSHPCLCRLTLLRGAQSTRAGPRTPALAVLQGWTVMPICAHVALPEALL